MRRVAYEHLVLRLTVRFLYSPCLATPCQLLKPKQHDTKLGISEHLYRVDDLQLSTLDTLYLSPSMTPCQLNEVEKIDRLLISLYSHLCETTEVCETTTNARYSYFCEKSSRMCKTRLPGNRLSSQWWDEWMDSIRALFNTMKGCAERAKDNMTCIRIVHM